MWLLLQIVGVIFPVMIMALVPIRQYIMPCLFSRHTLHALDAAEYEAVPPVDQQEASTKAAPLELAELVCASTSWCQQSVLLSCGIKSPLFWRSQVVMMIAVALTAAAGLGSWQRQ